MEKLKLKFKSIRIQLFIAISVTILAMLVFLILINYFVYGRFYLYVKTNSLKTTFEVINANCSKLDDPLVEDQIEGIAIENGFDIIIKDGNNTNVYTSSEELASSINQINQLVSISSNKEEYIQETEEYVIVETKDPRTNIEYVMLVANLDNGLWISIRVPTNIIQESVNISNNFLYLITGITIVISAIVVTYVSKKFTEPIQDITKIANDMANLDFSSAYINKKTNYEIDSLGASINTMSKKLEATIMQLKQTNIELEKDIEEKSKIDEMRKSFISDVSHELKTPIALIQGYSEGLIENVNTDEESRKFYAEVILDETNKMDKLVKQLLELMKLEYGKREFNDRIFNIVELEKEVIKKLKVIIDEKNILIEWDTTEEINVIADDFYIEQVLTNYITNAIRYSNPIDGKCKIKISNKYDMEEKKVRVKVFNTGNSIPEEKIEKIWTRFYKIDESRNRMQGGSGVGLSFVKAIMNNYNNDYGVINKQDGVEFYFDLDIEI